ncbi:hypothetical protein HDE_11060 [Halotydeus destructor]|nr:hypothetical protein HDE_11060 [Halotydeus destructor]
MSNLFEKLFERLEDRNRNLVTMVMNGMVLGVAMITSALYVALTFNFTLLKAAVTMKTNNELPLAILFRHRASEILELFSAVSFIYSAMVIFASCQFALYVLAKQGVEATAAKPRNDIVSMNATRKTYQELLVLRRATTDILLIPNHLVAVVFANLALYCIHLGYTSKDETEVNLTFFEVFDSVLLLLTLMTVPLMVKLVDRQFEAYQKEACNLVDPYIAETDMKLAINRALISVDMSPRSVRPMQLLEIMACDSSLFIKLFSVLVPFALFVYCDLSEFIKRLKNMMDQLIESKLSGEKLFANMG